MPTCRERCESDYQNCLNRGAPSGCEQIRDNCLASCQKIIDEGCKSDAECGEGYRCVEGECQTKVVVGGSPCPAGGRKMGRVVGGGQLEKCHDDEYPATAQDGTPWCCKKTAKIGCKEDKECPADYTCVNGFCVAKKYCTTDINCPDGYFCDNGVCKKKGVTPDCPDGVGDKYTGCACGKKYMLKSAACATGYVPVKKPDGTQCECSKWCQDIGYGADCVSGGGDGGEQFQWGPDVSALIKRLMERANYFLDYPRGLTPEERQGVINYAYEGIKRGERGTLQSTKDMLSRMGLLGTGFEAQKLGEVRRGTTETVANVQRQVAIDELNRRFNELMATSGMAQSLTGTGMTAEQLVEALNAARRGEGSGAMNTLMAYLQTVMGGQSNTYWQAILNQMSKGGGATGGGIGDWLPWLMYLIPSLFPKGSSLTKVT